MAHQPDINQLASLLTEAVDAARKFLPTQPPIDVFIHHNTLHHFEEMQFEAAVEFVGEVRGARPYMPHAAYLKLYEEQRITLTDLQEVMDEQTLAHAVPCVWSQRVSPLAMTLAAILTPVEVCNAAKLQWLVEEGELLRGAEATEKAALWRVVSAQLHRHAARHTTAASVPPPRQSLTRGEVTLVALVSSYLAQDVRTQRHLDRSLGFARFAAVDGDPLAMIVNSLQARQIEPSAWPDFVRQHLLRLPGWAGAMGLADKRRELSGRVAPGSDLIDFLAVSLLLADDARDEAVDSYAAAPEHDAATVQLEFYRFCREVRLTAADLTQLNEPQVDGILALLSTCGEVFRRRCLHRAYERHYRNSLVDAMIAQRQEHPPSAAQPVSFQAVFCIDEREGSLRRHVEAADPACQTFGFAGFYGIDMRYLGHQSRHAETLCPGIMQPSRHVHEQVIGDHRPSRLATYFSLRRLLHAWTKGVGRGSAVVIGTGLLSGLPLVTGMMLPKFNRRVTKSWHQRLHGLKHTRLVFERLPADVDQGLASGFSLAEMADRVQTVLSAIGLWRQIAPLVFVLGHGSKSLNNPHKSAYDCGACGGRRGGPNGRTFALMANHPGVRATLQARGCAIPKETIFIGGYHDTCSDEIDLFDLDLVPHSHAAVLAGAQRVLDAARQQDAHERCRRFDNARHLSPQAALAHVESRAHDFRQPRPECGHATNAACIIGRRQLTRDLFLDRRVFLASYDPTQETDGSILDGLLAAVVPVCAGISLEYYFSYVDNRKYGSGSKLPHNITGFFGVMEGYASDNRTGLPWQMVEIHEPMRLVMLVEADAALVQRLVAARPPIQRLINNCWLQFGVICPTTGDVQWLNETGLTAHVSRQALLPSAASSAHYYSGRAEHLKPVHLKGGSVPHA